MKLWLHFPFRWRRSRSIQRLVLASKNGIYEVDIRRTSFGIPHIKAKDYQNLAFGIGFVYAQDNIELLADAILTARGERSAHFGAAATVSTGSISNLESDFFYKSYFDPDELENHCKRTDTLAAAMMEAYADGISRYLSEVTLEILPQPYYDVFRTSPISVKDLYILLGQKAVQTSGHAFAAAIANAQPPSRDVANSLDACSVQVPLSDPRTSACGSNAFALGSDLTANRRGLLVGNPHFPWFGPNRFYQMHLTIPGELDVMGASLPPFPLINIGFNADVAWSHTSSISRQFAIYELKLVPGNPLAYYIDGKIELMRQKTISVAIKETDGTKTDVQRALHTSRFGPIIVLPDMGCCWSEHHAYSLYDVTRCNLSMISQWLAINKARSVHELKNALASHRGTLWLNTLAADRHGDIFYGNFSAVPNLSAKIRRSCAASVEAKKIAEATHIPILDGSRRKAIPKVTGKPLNRRTTLRSEAMPYLFRRDYLLNSNDSHWLVNASHPLRGYSDLIGREQCAQGFRTRMAHKELAALIASRPEGINADDFKEMLFSNRNYAAELILDQLIELCRKSPHCSLEQGESLDLKLASKVLTQWDRCDDVDSRGAVLFREFWRVAQVNERIWKIPFDGQFPLTTPRDLNIDNTESAEFLKKVLADAVIGLQCLGLALDVCLGEVQKIPTKDGFIGIPGGDGSAGVLNLIAFGALDKDGYEPIDIQGTSYTQVVTWENNLVTADAILPCSQSSRSGSPHYADQTKLFAVKGWVRLPFTEAEIEKDPNLTSFRLTG